ncbi:MAG: 4,5-dihydroxyphthalate decarboxylase [Actinomycetota bacterium]|nr:4,5-dihydroxyphthalate decarboxylase [Actinomycetota bacterium]
MEPVELTVAMTHYDQMSDLVTGKVQAEGIRLRCLDFKVEEIFYRFELFREWEVSEMSMATYISLASRGDTTMVGLPVFPSRVFRHSSFYVRSGEISAPEKLAGKRIGVPEWAMTAAIYARALLTHEWGVPLQAVEWFQAGVNQAGRNEKVPLALPEGVRLTQVQDRSLDEMLLSGEIDAIISAHAPTSFERKDPRIERLFPDTLEMEMEYAKRTGVIPIMHLMVIKRETAESYPWVARNLFTAFDESRARSVARLAVAPAGPASRVPLLWIDEALKKTKEAFGGLLFPYGVEENRQTLEAFVKWSYEQGVAHRLLSVEELFPSQVGTGFKI